MQFLAHTISQASVCCEKVALVPACFHLNPFMLERERASRRNSAAPYAGQDGERHHPSAKQERLRRGGHGRSISQHQRQTRQFCEGVEVLQCATASVSAKWREIVAQQEDASSVRRRLDS